MYMPSVIILTSVRNFILMPTRSTQKLFTLQPRQVQTAFVIHSHSVVDPNSTFLDLLPRRVNRISALRWWRLAWRRQAYQWWRCTLRAIPERTKTIPTIFVLESMRTGLEPVSWFPSSHRCITQIFPRCTHLTSMARSNELIKRKRTKYPSS